MKALSSSTNTKQQFSYVQSGYFNKEIQKQQQQQDQENLLHHQQQKKEEEELTESLKEENQKIKSLLSNLKKSTPSLQQSSKNEKKEIDIKEVEVQTEYSEPSNDLKDDQEMDQPLNGEEKDKFISPTNQQQKGSQKSNKNESNSSHQNFLPPPPISSSSSLSSNSEQSNDLEDDHIQSKLSNLLDKLHSLHSISYNLDDDSSDAQSNQFIPNPIETSTNNNKNHRMKDKSSSYYPFPNTIPIEIKPSLVGYSSNSIKQQQQHVKLAHISPVPPSKVVDRHHP